MKGRLLKKRTLLTIGTIACLLTGSLAFAAVTSGVGAVANQVTTNLGSIAKLITAASYVAGMGCGVASILKFKAYKDAPQQTPIGMPIALLFVAAALLFIPSVYKTSGGTLFGGSGTVAGVSGVTSFGAPKAT